MIEINLYNVTDEELSAFLSILEVDLRKFKLNKNQNETQFLKNFNGENCGVYIEYPSLRIDIAILISYKIKNNLNFFGIYNANS